MVVIRCKTENQNCIVSDANFSFWSQKNEILFLIRESICEKIEAGSLFISTFSSRLCPVRIILCFFFKFCRFVDSLNQMSFFQFWFKALNFLSRSIAEDHRCQTPKATVSVLTTGVSSPQPWIFAPTATAIYASGNKLAWNPPSNLFSPPSSSQIVSVSSLMI